MSATRKHKKVAEVADNCQGRQPRKSTTKLRVRMLVAEVADSYSQYVNYRKYTPCALYARTRKGEKATTATTATSKNEV